MKVKYVLLHDNKKKVFKASHNTSMDAFNKMIDYVNEIDPDYNYVIERIKNKYDSFTDTHTYTYILIPKDEEEEENE